MKYMGSMRRIARHILPIILADREPGQHYAEPFCGGCNLIDKVTGPRIANDAHPYLIALLREQSSGYLFRCWVDVYCARRPVPCLRNQSGATPVANRWIPCVK